MDEVSILSQPSDSQKELWGEYLIVGDGCDSEGNWFGWCPLHGERGDVEAPTAQFNFRRGIIRCFGEPSCHDGQRTMSLWNFYRKMMASR